MKLHFISFTVFIVVSNACMQTARAQWVQTGGPSGRNVLSLALSGSNIFAGTDSGVFLSTNYGTDWTAVNSGLTNMNVRALAVSGSNIFAGTSYGVFLSTNNGTSWTAVDSGLPPSTPILSFAVSGSNIFAGTDGKGLYLSTDSGTSWTAANVRSPYILSLAVSGSNIFAGTVYDGVILSTDNGTSWTAVNSVNFPPFILSLTVSGSTIFAGTDWNSVYLSTDRGTSWTVIDSGLPGDTDVWSLAVSDNNIFAGTDRGFFLSTISGTNWTAVNSGLTCTDIRSLTVIDSNIFAGTYGSGVWRRPLSEMVDPVNTLVPQERRNQALLKVNPANRAGPMVHVECIIPHRELVRVKIYNPAGREIFTIVNKQLNAGTYRYWWNTNTVPQSCYLVKMQSVSYSFVKNLSITR